VNAQRTIAAEPTITEIKGDLDELHYQADNMGASWLLDVERHYRWLLNEYLRSTLSTERDAE
jgi:hypothetical protein